MNLRDATNFLLRDPEVANWLRLADTHIQSYNKMPAQFVLPSAHKVLHPIIEAFATDTSAFVDYIKAVRDASDAKAYDDLHELYRMVSMRVLQVERRHRLRKACLILIPKLNKALKRDTIPDEHIRVVRFIEQRWGAMRLESMARERRLRKADRLTSEERTILLDRFWADIDKKLDGGTVPLGGSEYLQEIVEMLDK